MPEARNLQRLESLTTTDTWVLLWCRNQGAFHVERLFDHVADIKDEFDRCQWFDQWVVLDYGTEDDVRATAAKLFDQKGVRFADDVAAGRVVEHVY